MNLFNRFRKTCTTPSEEQAEHLQNTGENWYTVEVHPPREKQLPASLPRFVRGILELQSSRLGLKNTSPVTAYEIRRPQPETLRFQYSTSTKRLERKIRTQLTSEIPGVRFREGVNGIPANQEESIGGGLLTTGRQDHLPLQTDFDTPPINALTATLHRHAMQDTRFIIQILFQPVTGEPLRNWWWRKRGILHRNYLKKEKQKLWGSIKPTKREKHQAHSIDQKTGNSRYHVSIRFLIIGAGEQHIPSRVKELASSFNRFENPATGQYLNAVTIQTLRENTVLNYAKAVAQRRFNGWSRKNRFTTEELAALLTLPSHSQQNIHYAEP
jgi:hypothetical protein